MKRLSFLPFFLAGMFISLTASPVLAAESSHGAGHQMQHSQHIMASNNHDMMPDGRQPTLPGQDAFGAMQEIISILEADPDTDWSRVNISGLRAHLVDMNRLVMDTEVVETRIEGGLRIIVSGKGVSGQDNTITTIHAMLPAHAPMINGLNSWTAHAETTPTGARLTVTANTKKEIAHIRGLGFYGLMASGAHHQTHHIGLARGENVHNQ